MSTSTLSINGNDFSGVSDQSRVEITVGCPTNGTSTIYVNVYDWESNTYSGEQDCGEISENATVSWSWGNHSGSGEGTAAVEKDPQNRVPVIIDPQNRVPYAPGAGTTTV